MSEDVSATMRVGITVILVAALVATVLNLMVMSNSILSNGQTTLQSGIDSVSEQEFATYDNKKVSGTQVATALSLFQGRDVAILVETTSLRKTVQDSEVLANEFYGLNYGALVTSDGQPSNGDENYPSKAQYKPALSESQPASVTWTGAAESKGGIKGASTNPSDIAAKVGKTLISSTAKTAFIVKCAGSNAGSGTYAVKQNSGEPFFTGYMHNTNGLVDSNYDIVGTTVLGNDAYLLSSARFTSVLIKDPTGSIVGIVFRQVS